MAEEKKNVLLIGDSIRMGYCSGVKSALAHIANVYYPEENCRYTQYVITSLRGWSENWDADKIDLVHFNCGHWDIAHWNNDPHSLTDLKSYEHNISRIIRHIRKLFPKAEVCFATTTPMHPHISEQTNSRTNEEIRQYNEVGVRAAKSEKAGVNDLFALMEDKGEEVYFDYCHFTNEGYSILAKAVAKFLEERL